MKLKIDTEYCWDYLNDKQRIALILEIIYCAPNAQDFKSKILKAIEKMEVD
jgi:hypothetical protein